MTSTPVVPRLDLTPQPLASVLPDASQEAALALIEQGGPVSVFGAPGTGKTMVAELAAAAAVRAGRRVLVVTPERHIAKSLSARIVRRSGVALERRVAVTPAALAMSVLQARAEAIAAQPWDGAAEAARAFAPQMVTGAEQLAAFSELLALEALTGQPAIAWPNSAPPAARLIPAFRAELRDLLMRAAERGLDAVALAELGQAQGRPEWVAAAQFLQAYLDGLDVRGAADSGLKLDVASLVATAHACLRDWAEPFEVAGRTVVLAEVSRPTWDLVIADDYQEASLALHRLMARLGADGAQLVALGSPESAVQGYRGALPGQLAQTLHDAVTPDASAGPPPASLGRVTWPEGGSAADRRPDLGRGEGPELSPSPSSGRDSAEVMPGELGWGARPTVLEKSWRFGGGLADLVHLVRLRVRSPGAPRAARRPPAPAGPAGVDPASGQDGGAASLVRTWTAGSGTVAAAMVAHRFRRAHLVEGLPWDQMAVLTRTASQVGRLRSTLIGAGVPVRVPGSEVLATDHRAVAPLVWALRCSADPGELTPALAARLLTSVVGGLDAAELRLLRRQALAAWRARRGGADAAGTGGASGGGAAEAWPSGAGPGVGGKVERVAGVAVDVGAAGFDGGGEVTSDDLLVWLLGGELAPAAGGGPLGAAGFDAADLLEAARRRGLPRDVVDRVGALARGLAAGRGQARRDRLSSAAALWAVWEGFGLAEAWRDRALVGGAGGVRADADLDAVLALFAAASRHDARQPGAGVGGFLAHVDAQEVPSDTIAPHAPEGGKVWVSTVAAAVGHPWALVALAGLEEDVWPDLRLRDTLLGAGQLADLVDGKGGVADPIERRRAVAEDEARMLVLAASRARRELLAVAVDDEDERPSRFFEWLAAGASPDQANSGSGGGGDGRAGDDRAVGGTGCAGGDGGDAPEGAGDPRGAGGDGGGDIRGEGGGEPGPDEVFDRGGPMPFDLRGLVAAARSRLVAQVEAELADQRPLVAPAGFGAGQVGADSLGGAAPSVAGAQATGLDTAGAKAAGEAAAGRRAGAETGLDGIVHGMGDEPPVQNGAEAAEVLAVLAAIGVAGADPDSWPGLLEPSSDEPLFGEDSQPVLSPSGLELLFGCPLSWALQQVGGRGAAGPEASLGSLVHSLAEEFGQPETLAGLPDPSSLRQALADRLAERWAELGLAEGYTERTLRLRAENMVRNLAAYLDQRRGQAPVALERRVDPSTRPAGPVLPVRLSGVIDRLERDQNGGIEIVDFKTGRQPPTEAQAKRNPQLGAYQVALAAGLVEGLGPAQPAGARLVFLDKSVKGEVKQLRQPALRPGDPWMEEVMETCRAAVGRSWFEAKPGDQCRHCPVQASCPAKPKGKQVTA
ncbi:MAG: PD-(D/E)XK nuclease family protein [Bifidobacteriaceae bacterium]|jgi:superfamily I DNA/RNA helicase/RecB family exonuclease|nr:PD-(D/E)XK nuclease family protein [Bifidobacteriaceae bacterium]